MDIEGKLVGGAESLGFHDFFKELLGKSKNKIIVNLHQTPWANSLGIGMLIGAHASVKKAGGELVLAYAGERIQNILEVTQLVRIFKTFDSDEEAIAYLSQP